ncbi:hypothetical protein [Bacillus subtilis]|uniref:hypothetical protein n=1 Tax=Bacillus subtilis TaxID=1423 RepID=UPI000A9F2FA1|nr:hypothetical protein [Bacillus subtilis]URM20832.1 hypothetical protein JNE32_01925 [Bacillus subtilis]
MINGLSLSVSVKSVKAKDLAVIDPHEASLENWRRYTSRILMRYLRSPSVQQRKWSNCFMQAAVFRMSARAGICDGEKD